MTDATARHATCRAPSVSTALDLGGSKALTDDGVRHLARLAAPRASRPERHRAHRSRARRAAAICRRSSRSRCGGRASPTTASQHLAHCHELERVNLGWTRTGDGAIRALAGKAEAAQSDDGRRRHRRRSRAAARAAGLQDVARRRGEDGAPRATTRSPITSSLRGSFTDRGMQHLRGLDGLFGLNLDDSSLAITAAALVPLVDAAESRLARRRREGRLDAAHRRDAAPALPRRAGHDGGRRRVRRAQPVALDRVHLGPALSQPADARVHGAREHAGAARAVGELSERGRRRHRGAAELSRRCEN